MPFFAVATTHGSWLSRAPGSTLLGHAPPGQGEVVLLCVPAATPGLGFLLAPSGVLGLADDPWTAPLLPLRLSNASALALHHPATGLLLSAAPLTEGAAGSIVADRTSQGAWESFRLQEVTTSAQLDGFVAVMERLAAAGDSAVAMLAILDSGEAVPPDLLQAIGRLLPLRELDSLARTLLARPVARERLALLLPDDPWAARALPRLGRWLAAPDEQRHERRCGPELALLAEAGRTGLPASFPQALNAAARRAVAPRRSLCVVALARGAGPSLLEWVAHHRRLGVEHVFLYADLAEAAADGTAGVMTALARSGVLTLVDMPAAVGVDPLAEAHGHALQVLADLLDFRWVALLDTDEFLWPGDDTAGLIGTLAALEAMPAQAVALPALTFEPCGLLTAGQGMQPPELVTERFTRRLPEPDPRARPVLRASLFVQARADAPVAPPLIGWTYRGPDGSVQPVGSAAEPTRLAAPRPDLAVVAHYPARSAEEFVLRRWDEGGRAPELPRLDPASVAAFLERFDAAGLQPDARLAATAPALRAELERLLALPDVREGQEAAVQAQIAHLVVARRMLRENERFRVPGTPEGRLLGLLQGGPARSGAAPAVAAPAAVEAVTAAGAFFRLSTCNGSHLHVDLAHGRVVAAFEASADRIPAILHAPAGRPDLLVLVAATEEPVEFALVATGLRASAHVLEVGWLPDGRLTLVDAASGRFASAAPDSAPGRPAPVLMDRSTAGDWEGFVPAGVPDIFVPRAARDRAARIDALIASGPSLEAVLALVEEGPAFAADALNAVLPLLPWDMLREAAMRMRDSALHGRRLVACFPDDPWATVALPSVPAATPGPARPRSRLRLPGRAAAPAAAAAVDPASRPAHRVIGASLDRLAEAGRHGAFASFPHALSAQARAGVQPGRELCIVASARNEGAYLLEWLAHHRLLGVEAVFLYTNDNDDASDPLLAALAAAGVITWLDSRVGAGTSPQLKAYGHAFGLLPDLLEFRWSLVLDVDEFVLLDPDRFATLPDYLRWQERREVDAVALNWLFMGSTEPAPGEDWTALPLTRRCGRVLGQQHVGEGVRLVKTLSRPRCMVHSGPHAPVTDERRGFVYRTASGELHRFHNPAAGYPPDPQFADAVRPEAAAVCHFYFKSAEEWLWKQSRIRGASPLLPRSLVMAQESATAFLAQHGRRDVRGDDRLARCTPGLEAEMARLRALPGVAAAEQAVRVAVRARLARIHEAYRSEPGPRGWDAHSAAFLGLAGVTLPEPDDAAPA